MGGDLVRADILTARILSCGRGEAKDLIGQGLVGMGGKPLKKCGAKVPEDAALEISLPEHRYVSRGGRKLSHAMDFFGVSAEGAACADIGASTGGFTDCLLQRGARKVYAVDNGSGQLDKKLAADPRVVSLEGINARNLTWDILGERCPLVVADLSFISLTLALEPIKGVLSPGGQALCLVKPQFESGRKAVGKDGVVKDARARAQAVGKVVSFGRSLGFELLGTCVSALAGSDGNIEHFILLKL
jgi:23S rRNA (cytidine1920-2'-O)/16S rRNA (cytidine1409-2'-O)-methyltransferase